MPPCSLERPEVRPAAAVRESEGRDDEGPVGQLKGGVLAWPALSFHPGVYAMKSAEKQKTQQMAPRGLP